LIQRLQTIGVIGFIAIFTFLLPNRSGFARGWFLKCINLARKEGYQGNADKKGKEEIFWK